jgi:hypothetical protein
VLTSASPLSALTITVNGLPAHPLIVHAGVVFTPLAVVGALAYLVPRWRDWLRWPLLGVSVLAALSMLAAAYTGGNYRDSEASFHQGALGAQLDKHATYAGILTWVVCAFAVVVLGTTVWLHHRVGTLRTAAGGLIGVLAVVSLVYVFLTGEAGARAVYPPSTVSASSSQH